LAISCKFNPFVMKNFHIRVEMSKNSIAKHTLSWSASWLLAISVYLLNCALSYSLKMRLQHLKQDNSKLIGSKKRANIGMVDLWKQPSNSYLVIALF